MGNEYRANLQDSLGAVSMVKLLYNKNNMNQFSVQNKENLYIKGIHKMSVCDITDKRAWNLQCLIEGVKAKRDHIIKEGKLFGEDLTKTLHALWQEYNYYIEKLHKNFLVSQQVVENKIVMTGRSPIVQRLAGFTTYSGIINYGALGTSATGVVDGNIKLGTEVFRKGLSSGTFVNDTCVLENFYTATEISGTFQEYGFFMDGNASADSGQLFNRWTATQAKTTAQTLNMQSTIALAST